MTPYSNALVSHPIFVAFMGIVGFCLFVIVVVVWLLDQMNSRVMIYSVDSIGPMRPTGPMILSWIFLFTSMNTIVTEMNLHKFN